MIYSLSMYIWLYAIVSVIIVSIASVSGLALFAVTGARLTRLVALLLSLAAGTLFGDAFIHLLPEAAETIGFGRTTALTTLSGIVSFFIIEKFIHWRHCHKPEHALKHSHHVATMSLFGDLVHNVIDGLLIGASYLVSVPVGIATTIAVFIHEIPQEISDFAILLHSGFSRGKALLFNFLISLGALGGVVVALLVGANSEAISGLMIPFAAGAFIYIAGADLIPEMQKETTIKVSLLQLLAFIVGIAIMMALTFFE